MPESPDLLRGNNMKTHQTHYQGKPYVRLTFVPHGAEKKRTVWAIQEGPATYRRMTREGSIWHGRGGKAQEIILALPHEVEAEPAGVSLHYARMEVLTS